jgi:hypothetical protein
MKRHSELEIKTLQNAPRDAAKLRRLLEIKQRQKEQAMHIEDTCRLRFTKPSEAYYMRALSEKSALVAQPGRAKVS